MSTVGRLFQSRKFLVLLLDTVISLASLFLTRYAAPESTDLVIAVIAILQPAVLMYINAVAKEDAAAKDAGTFEGRFK